MGFKKFSLLIILRTILAMVTIVALALLISIPGYHATILLLSAILIAQFVELIRFVAKTNAELVRFFEAVRYADFSQRFELKDLGSGFDELGSAFGDILKRLQKTRNSQEEQLRQIKAVIEHVPVPLLSINQNGNVTLWNNSARRLFGANEITKVDDFSKFNEKFPLQIQNINAGERALVNISIDDIEHKLIISATKIITASHHETLLSMQDIQSELAIAQLQAWQDLVSVLTHEIMNSITPVASLAKTAVDLVQDVQEKANALPEVTGDIHEDLCDVHGAVQTVSRRSDGLMKFVTSYRRLTRLPAPKKRIVSLSKLFDHAKLLATQDWQAQGIALSTVIVPSELDVSVDVEMIEQVLINLLQNAQQALSKVSSAQVMLKAYLNIRGHVVIEVSDNGRGIEKENMSQIFVPFFTTKKEGSGVGLALTRQVMIAHNGKVSVRNNSEGGATFCLTF